MCKINDMIYKNKMTTFFKILILIIFFPIQIFSMEQNSSQNKQNENFEIISNIGDYCNEPDIDYSDKKEGKTKQEIIQEMDRSFYDALNQFEECKIGRAHV